MQVKDIMVRDVETVNPDMAIEALAKLLLERSLTGVPVVSGAGELVGIVSEGDLLHKECTPRLPNFINLLGAVIFYNGVDRFDDDFKKLMAHQVADIMTETVLTVKEDAEVDEAARLMIENKIRQIPVVGNDGCLVGLVRRADIIKLLLPA